MEGGATQHNPDANHLHLVAEPTVEPAPQESWDERVIREGIEAALAEGRNIDGRTARYIAGQLHEGQTSALYALASAGAVPEEVHDELTRDFDSQTDEVRNWINWLGAYCLDRADRGPVEGWAAQAAALDRDDERRLRREAEQERLDELFSEQPDEEIGSVDELGWCGLVRHEGRPGGLVLAQHEDGSRHTWETDSDEELAERWSAIHAEYADFYYQGPDDQEADDDAELDTFTWTDAARWRPEDADAASINEEGGASLPGGFARQGQPTTPEERVIVDRLSGARDEAQIGREDELGWFAYLREPGRAGGVILSRDDEGCEHAWETDSDEELAAKWEEIAEAYRRYRREQWIDSAIAHNAVVRRDGTGEPASSAAGPEIWVASLADYNSGHLHGVWLDATLDPDELREAARYMLSRGYAPGAEEWAIFDHSGFEGFNLNEYEDLETVSRLANGIEEHGPAFAAWAEYLGSDDMDRVENTFRDAYLGTWESMQAYVEQYLDDSEAYRFMDHVPEWLQPHVSIDVESVAQEFEADLYVVETDGGVIVFDTRLG